MKPMKKINLIIKKCIVITTIILLPVNAYRSFIYMFAKKNSIILERLTIIGVIILIVCILLFLYTKYYCNTIKE
jgi:hypothetical protein